MSIRYLKQVAHAAGTYPSFHGKKREGVLQNVIFFVNKINDVKRKTRIHKKQTYKQKNTTNNIKTKTEATVKDNQFS